MLKFITIGRNPGGGGGTFLYELYRYISGTNGYGFLTRFGQKYGKIVKYPTQFFGSSPPSPPPSHPGKKV